MSASVSQARVAKSSLGVSAALLGGAALEFARDIYIARTFGAGIVTDAFFLAIVLPVVLGGALYNLSQIVFLPWLAEARERGEELHERGGLVFITTFPLLFLVAFLSYLFAPQIAYVLGGPAIDLAVFERIVRYTLPALGLLLQASMLSAYLNARGMYTAVGLRRVLNHTTFLLTAIWILPNHPSDSRLGTAFLLGYAVEYLYVLAWVTQRLRPRHVLNSLRHWESYRVTLRSAGWPALALAGARLNIVAERYVASYLGIGVVSVVSYTRRLMLAVGTITGQGINLVTLAEASHLRGQARDSTAHARPLLNNSLRLAALILVPIAATMLLLGDHVAELLFATRHFSGENLALSGILIRIFGVSLPFYVARPLLLTYFYAHGRTREPSLLNLGTVGLNLGIMLAAAWLMGPVGIGVAFFITMVIGTVWAWWLVTREYGAFVAYDFSSFLAKIVLVSGACGLVILGAYIFLAPRVNLVNQFIDHLVAISVAVSMGVPVYLLGTIVLNIRESYLIINWLHHRVGGEG